MIRFIVKGWYGREKRGLGGNGREERGRKYRNCERRKGEKEREKDGLGYCFARFYSFLG